MYELQFKHATTYIEKYKEIANNKFADLFEVALHEKCVWKLNCIKFGDWQHNRTSDAHRFTPF